jgi:hypothetical protein
MLRQKVRVPHVQAIFLLLLLLPASDLLAATAPYPPSQAITGVSWNFDSHKQAAPGSDLWPVTWASDNHIYTSWGDGGGFGGTNDLGRVTIGVGRIEGSADALNATNTFGGFNAEAPATFEGKPIDMIALDDAIYMMVTKQDTWDAMMACKSTDGAKTWTCSGWNFETSFQGYVQYGKGNENIQNGYIYQYVGWSLGRVPVNQVLDRSAYEFVSGFDTNNNPTWTSDINLRKTVIDDKNGIGQLYAIYNAALGRYIATYFHSGTWQVSTQGAWAILDAPYPWGPWTTVAYYGAGEWIDSEFKFGFAFPLKWLSADGKDFVLVFSGTGSFDTWNTIKGSFITGTPTVPPSTPATPTITIQGK